MKKNNKSPFDIEPRFIKLDNRKNRPLVPITKEFLEKRGTDFKYVPMLGDRKPALNYRN